MAPEILRRATLRLSLPRQHRPVESDRCTGIPSANRRQETESDAWKVMAIEIGLSLTQCRNQGIAAVNIEPEQSHTPRGRLLTSGEAGPSDTNIPTGTRAEGLSVEMPRPDSLLPCGRKRGIQFRPDATATIILGMRGYGRGYASSYLMGIFVSRLWIASQ